MDDAEILRESLRNGRITKADTNTHTNDTDHDHASGTTIQDAGRTTARTSTDSRHAQNSSTFIRSNQRSNDQESVGIRPTVGRLGNRDQFFNASIPDSTAERQREQIAGNFIAVDEDSDHSRFTAYMTENPHASLRTIGQALGFGKDKAKRLRDDWQQQNPLKEKKVKQPIPQLSKKEQEEKKETLKASLESDFQYLDEYLWSREEKAGKSTDRMPVWTDMDDEELERVCSALVRWSQKNRAVNATVNAINDSSDYIAVGMAFGPRIKRTVDKIRETRIEKEKRPRRAHTRVVEGKGQAL